MEAHWCSDLFQICLVGFVFFVIQHSTESQYIQVFLIG